MIDAIYVIAALATIVIALWIKYEYDDKHNKQDYDN